MLPPAVPATLGRFVLEGQTVRFEPAPGAAVDLKGAPVTAPVVLKDDGSGSADELASGTVKMAVHVSGERRSLRVWDPERSAGTRLQRVHLVPDSARSPRHRTVHSRRGAAHRAGDEHVRRPRYLHHGGRRRVHARRAHAAPAAVHHAAQALLLRVQGRVERHGDLRRGALPLRRPARRRRRGARLQPGLQPALRVQPVHDLPDSAAREPAAA